MTDYQRFKIALNIKGESIAKVAADWGFHPNSVYRALKTGEASDPLRSRLVTYINEADQLYQKTRKAKLAV